VRVGQIRGRETRCVAGRRHFNLTDDSERPIGEWNDYKIVCDRDEILSAVWGYKHDPGTNEAVCFRKTGYGCPDQALELRSPE